MESLMARSRWHACDNSGTETEQRGLDPNVWFGNVERVASERIGRETVTCVSNIYKYYVSYRLLNAQRDRRDGGEARFGSASDGKNSAS